jgi:threonine dehydrogenase-like Zn-dependent dehydrogenase
MDIGAVMGHEFVGEVVEMGDEVASLAVGDAVTSPFTTNCGECYYCGIGLTARCERGQLFGWIKEGIGLHGGQAEYVRVPFADTTLMKIPDGVSREEALLLGDIFSTAYYCAEMASIQPGGVYAVIGCGPVGLLAIIAARDLGAETVFAMDIVDYRLELARELGAYPINVEKDDPVRVLRPATEGRGVDGVLEAVGSRDAVRTAITVVRPGGVISSVGVHTEPHFAFSPAEAYDKNLVLRTGRCPARHYMTRLMPLLVEKKYDITEVISHRAPLEKGPAAYNIFDRKLDGCTKVILSP